MCPRTGILACRSCSAHLTVQESDFPAKLRCVEEGCSPQLFCSAKISPMCVPLVDATTPLCLQKISIRLKSSVPPKGIAILPTHSKALRASRSHPPMAPGGVRQCDPRIAATSLAARTSQVVDKSRKDLIWFDTSLRGTESGCW